MGENTSKKPEKKKNDSQDLEQDLTGLKNLESELSDPPEEKLLKSILATQKPHVNQGEYELILHFILVRLPTFLPQFQED